MVNSALLSAAFIQGVFTFFAPCAVALLPGYLSRVINRKSDSNEQSPTKLKLLMRSLYLALFTILGIIFIYALFGGLLIAFKEVMKPVILYLSLILGVVVIILGIMMLMGKSISISIHNNNHGNSGNEMKESFIFGFGYGIAALGCLFPFFLVIATAALQAPTIGETILYFAAYALGMSLMMLTFYILALFSKKSLQRFIRKYLPIFTKVSGVIVILSGVYIIWYQSILIF